MRQPVDGVRYRWLNGWEATDEEWALLDLILQSRNWPSLNKATTKIRIAEEVSSGKLLGFLVLQLFPHVEPMWVENERRGTGVAEQLVADTVTYLRECQTRSFEFTADSPHVARYAEQYGLKKVESPVYRAEAEWAA